MHDFAFAKTYICSCIHMCIWIDHPHKKDGVLGLFCAHCLG